MTGPFVFKFLSEGGEIQSARDWNDPHKSKLWLYNLHYFSDLLAADSDRRSEWHQMLMARWIAENPVGCGIGWEPYPISIRVAHWLKWYLAGNELDAAARQSLTQQVRFLLQRLEFHLLGNHLLENFKALVLAGSVFSGREANGWRAEGLVGLERELAEQVLPDGGHYELSPMYHALVLEGLLDLVNTFRCFGQEVPNWLSDACQRMTRWSLAMVHADGDWPQFNDTSLGFAATPLELAQYAHKLGLSTSLRHADVVNLAHSGFVRAEQGPWLLFADVGGLGPDFNPGHGHADSLTYELGLRGARLVVDTGVSTYEVCDRRLVERSTAAHNTVQIDGKNSSDVWKSFRVGRRARVRDVTVASSSGQVKICATHDGYRYLQGCVGHRREWRLAGDRIEVTDSIESQTRHTVNSYIHLSPECTASMQSDGALLILDRANNRVASVSSTSWPHVRIETYWRAREFGLLEPATRIVFGATSISCQTFCYAIILEQDCAPSFS